MNMIAVDRLLKKPTQWYRKASLTRLYLLIIGGIVLSFGMLVLRLPQGVFAGLSTGWIIIILLELRYLIHSSKFRYWMMFLISIILFLSFTWYFKLDRDYAAYSSNAYYLIHNQGFFSEAFAPERGLDLWQGQYTPAFLFGYSIFLALFVSILGDYGLVLANVVLMISVVMFLEEIYRIVFPNARESSPLIYGFFLLNPILIWIFSQTYSETLFLTLVWGSIMVFLMGVIRHSVLYLIGGLIGMGVSCIVRVEGIVVSIMMTFASIAALFHIRPSLKKIILFMSGILLLAGIIGLSIYRISGSYVFHQYSDVARTVDVSDKDNTRRDILERFDLIVGSFGTYGIILLILWMISYPFWIRNKLLWWVIAIISPFSIYLYNPRITRDFPWLLRRYVSVIIPFMILVATWCIWEITRDYPRVRRGLLITFFSFQIMFSFLIGRDSVDHRNYYEDLYQFIRTHIPESDIRPIFVSGDFERPNEASRISPFLASKYQVPIITSRWQHIQLQQGYFLSTELYPDTEQLTLLGSFDQSIEVFNPNINPDRYVSRFKLDSTIELYLYRIEPPFSQ